MRAQKGETKLRPLLGGNGAQRNESEALAQNEIKMKQLARSNVRASAFLKSSARYARNHDRRNREVLVSISSNKKYLGDGLRDELWEGVFIRLMIGG
jgi:hypothetical protein